MVPMFASMEQVFSLIESEVCMHHSKICVNLFVVAATQARPRRAEQNPHQRESTTQTNDELERLCCGSITQEFTRQLRHPKLERHGDGL